MNRGLFITATDTGVGKTMIACGIARLLADAGAKVGVFKPFATGDREDAERLIAAARVKDPLDLVNPQHFRLPLAPSVAANLEHRRLRMEAVYQAFWTLSKRYEVMLVEGAGGVMVPLGQTTYMLDLIQALRLPALVVARAGLGTLNHSLLTFQALDQAKVPLAGILLNGTRGRTPAELTNADALQDHVTTAVYGPLAFRAGFARNVDSVARALGRLPGFLKAIKRTCGVA